MIIRFGIFGFAFADVVSRDPKLQLLFYLGGEYNLQHGRCVLISI
jgi:hypothetical protein